MRKAKTFYLLRSYRRSCFDLSRGSRLTTYGDACYGPAVKSSERPTRKPTIKDIARKVGVSTTTVINVLKNRNTQASAATIQKVKQTAQALGYVRNLTAASLVSRRAHAIALVITGGYSPSSPESESDINPFYGELILRLEHEARRHGYMLSVFGGDESDYVNYVLERNLDAAVLLGIRKPDLPRILARQGIQVVLMDSAFQDPIFAHVRTDDLRGGELAAEHLLSRGCRKIAFAGNTGMAPNAVPTLRLRGARLACERAGVPLLPFDLNAQFESGRAAAGDAIRSGADGIVAAADNLAAGLVRGLLEAGARVPEDVAVVGYDNLVIARTTQPALTTMDQGLGEKVRAVVDLIRTGRAGETRVIAPTLVRRQSA